jgi:hypothetical protein
MLVKLNNAVFPIVHASRAKAISIRFAHFIINYINICIYHLHIYRTNMYIYICMYMHIIYIYIYIDIYALHYTTICVLMLLHMCPHTT